MKQLMQELSQTPALSEQKTVVQKQTPIIPQQAPASNTQVAINKALIDSSR